MESYTITVLAVSIVLQLAAAGFALRLIRQVTEGWYAWVLIAGALVLMAARRIMTLVGFLVPELAVPLKEPLAESVALVIAAFMLVGVLLIPRVFRALHRTAAALETSVEALRKSEERLRTVFESALDGMFVIDMQGRYVDVNPAGCRMFGYTREEILRSDIRLLLFPEDVEKAFAGGRTSWRRGAFIPEYRMRRKDGSEIWVEMSIAPFQVGQEALALGVKRDITERKRAEEALQESEARFRMITEGALSGVYIIQDQKFRYVNPALAQIFGYSPQEVIDRLGPLDLTHPEDRSLVAENVRRRLEREAESVHYTFRGLRKDGTVVHCEVLGRRMEYRGRPAIIGTLLDITQRKQAEEALQERLAELERFRKATIHREFRIQELREEVKRLRSKLLALEKAAWSGPGKSGS